MDYMTQSMNAHVHAPNALEIITASANQASANQAPAEDYRQLGGRRSNSKRYEQRLQEAIAYRSDPTVSEHHELSYFCWIKVERPCILSENFLKLMGRLQTDSALVSEHEYPLKDYTLRRTRAKNGPSLASIVDTNMFAVTKCGRINSKTKTLVLRTSDNHPMNSQIPVIYACHHALPK